MLILANYEDYSFQFYLLNLSISLENFHKNINNTKNNHLNGVFFMPDKFKIKLTDEILEDLKEGKIDEFAIFVEKVLPVEV